VGYGCLAVVHGLGLVVLHCYKFWVVRGQAIEVQHNTNTDSKGKVCQKKGPRHGWGMRIMFEGECVIKTKEMAQKEAALDHDDLKNKHEGLGKGVIPTGKRGKYYNEYNFPTVINEGRSPDARDAIDYVVNVCRIAAKVVLRRPRPYYVPQ
jgi:hypothetical protein